MSKSFNEFATELIVAECVDLAIDNAELETDADMLELIEEVLGMSLPTTTTSMLLRCRIMEELDLENVFNRIRAGIEMKPVSATTH